MSAALKILFRLMLVIAGPCVAMAEQGSFFAPRGSLFETVQPGPDSGGQVHLASLFTGQQGTSLFAPYPERRSRLGSAAKVAGMVTQAGMIRALIGKAEAGKKGYDAIQHGAVDLPAKRPTQLTVGEIYAWIARTPGQQHAIGRYQFIPKTLTRLIVKAGVPEGAMFTPQVQDQLADVLLAEAGLHALENGGIGRLEFMKNIAKIWAGLPTSSGKSYYHGYAGNKATMTWAHFDAEMQKIFPG